MSLRVGGQQGRDRLKTEKSEKKRKRKTDLNVRRLGCKLISKRHVLAYKVKSMNLRDTT